MFKSRLYEHLDFESKIYDFGKASSLFEPIAKSKKSKNFSIILPPPNITGQLHLGHAWDGALQDSIIRYKKLCGYRTIGIPGTDHAGIATQTKFEKILKNNGVKRESLSDETFLSQLSAGSSEQAKYIRSQGAKLGFALSYKNETYTLDNNVAALVKQTFKQLYDNGLIYQGYKLVNGDIKLQTAISDIEVKHSATNSKMYFFKYFVKGTNDFIVVATTRPETMFADVCVFVNPKDKRYAKIINKVVINPINGNELKVLSDSYVDMKFGTGAMKCTPAHDFNDYELAIKHKIDDYFTTMNMDGTLNNNARTKYHSYNGVDRLLARNNIVKDIERDGLLVEIIDHTNEVGYSERTGEIVEPTLSKQWFVKTKVLAKQTINLIKKQKPKFIPARFEKTMHQWLANMQDGCISRQLIWGHRIPVGYNKTNGGIVVGDQPINTKDYEQDKDVLDTGFSSGLGPLALTKRAKNVNLSDFYPISMLVTGYDILFFGVARMFFQCGYLSKQIPIQSVFLHGLIRDEQNRKMSKSLGNGIDPMVIVKEYGADALRLFLISTATVGEDLRFSTEKIKSCWAFINKLGNAHNFIGMHEHSTMNVKPSHVINNGIVNEFNETLKTYATHMDKYNFVVAYKHLSDFTGEKYCNQYLEFVKPLLNDVEYKHETVSTMRMIFKNILIMSHPHMPFATEQMYQDLFNDQKSIMLESWPIGKKGKLAKVDSELINIFINIYSNIRELRIKHGIKNAQVINVNLITKLKINLKKLRDLLKNFGINMERMTEKRLNNSANIITFGENAIEYVSDFEDSRKLKTSLLVELKRLEGEINRSEGILSNKNFITKAPKDKVDLEKKKLYEYKEQYEKTSVALNKIK